jgi:hypothetical protein
MYKLLAAIVGLQIIMVGCRHSSAPEAAPMEICGCMDTLALNNNPDATKCDPTQCRYAIDSVTGVYDVTDTYTTYGSMGPVVTTSNMQITVSRASAKALIFDNLLKCEKCENVEIPYTASTHSFHYNSYSDPYTSETGDGLFVGDGIRYTIKTINSLSGFTPNHKGSGIRHK